VRSAVAGYWRRASAGRAGLRSNFPPQFGHLPCRRSLAHSAQKVHSKEHIMTSRESGGRSRLQHSQLGFMSNMGPPPISILVRSIIRRAPGFVPHLYKGTRYAACVRATLCSMLTANGRRHGGSTAETSTSSQAAESLRAIAPSGFERHMVNVVIPWNAPTCMSLPRITPRSGPAGELQNPLVEVAVEFLGPFELHEMACVLHQYDVVVRVSAIRFDIRMVR